MKNNNLELELRRFEVSAWNDKITYEKHSYNGFSGLEGSNSYNNYLSELYNDYFFNFRQKIDVLITDRDTLLVVINDRITLFEDIKNDYLLKNDMYSHYDSYIQAHYRDMIGGNNNTGLKNDYDILQFHKEMSHTQMYYIEKAIEELKKMMINYTPAAKKGNTFQSKPTENKHYIDEYFEKHFANKDITNKEIKMMFDITRPTIQAWREEGKLIQISEEGKRPIKYDKEKLIEYLKDGIIKDRLASIQ